MNDLKISVVINTYNRAESLKITLESLRYQTDSDFEVVVVNGPSTDGTKEVLKNYEKAIKIIDCPQRNLSVSRNLGIEASSGDIVAFIDDDGIADPNWIKELKNAYDSEYIGGAGGLVYDHTGLQLQYEYSACDRKGDTDFNIEPPFDDYNRLNSDKFIYLQGTNCSFRKKCLEEINGFDEEFEYYLDEVDVALRIIEKGYSLKPLDNAIVHHKYIKSFLRNEKRVVTNPYSTVKNKYYFALKNARTETEKEAYIKTLKKWVMEVNIGGESNYRDGKLTKEQLDIYQEEVIKAVKDGSERSLQSPKTRKLIIQDIETFLPFKTIISKEKRLKICYVSKEYPPHNFGGIGRYTYDLATTFAKNGHEVHVITESIDQDTVDFEEGVWVHRLVSRLYEPYKNYSLGWNYSLAYRNFLEVERINKQGKVDIVNGPIWLSETSFLNSSGNYPTLVTLMTTQKILNQMKIEKNIAVSDFENKLMKYENISLKQHKYVHAISNSIKRNCSEYINENANIYISPLGCRDMNYKYLSNKDENKIIIFCAGRLEHRKGTDLLLEAAERILSEEKYKGRVKFVFAGKDGINIETGISYTKEFLLKNKYDKNIVENVEFLGEVTENELMQNYKNADICCTPSRYESFGIVLLEGMSFEKPIIASDCGGMIDIIVDGVNGFLFKQEDVEALTETIKKLLDAPELRKNIGKNARNGYELNYDLNAVYHSLYKIYSEIISDYEKNSEKKFDTPKIIELFMNTDITDVSIARKLSTDIKNGIFVLSGIENDNSSGKIVIVLKKLYKILTKFNPEKAFKVKEYLREDFNELKGNKGVKKISSLLKIFYHLMVKIPIVGPVIKYFGSIFLMPIKINKRLDTISLNVDHLNRNSDNILQFIEEKFDELGQELLKQRTKSDEITFVLDENNKILKYEIEDKKNILYDEINKRITDVRSELMYEMQSNNQNFYTDRKKIDSKIINKEKIKKLYNENKVFLNIGAGHICFDDYINIDEREIENIDIVSDVRNIPLSDNSVNKIYASHIVEHFTKNDLINNILPHWYNLLKESGELRIILPDLEEMIKNYYENNYDFFDMKEVIYGLQEYTGDVHYSLYGHNEMLEILNKIGFEANYKAVGRRNGKCFEMEIVGIKL